MRAILNYGAILLVCFLASNTNTSAQKIATDSKGESVFTFFSFSDVRVEFSTDEPLSLTTSFRRFLVPFGIPNLRNPALVKMKGGIVQLSMLNSGDFPVYNGVDKFRPGVGLKIGYHYTIRDFVIPAGGAWAGGFNGILNMDNIKLYNSADKTISKQYPVTYGIEGNFSHFRPGRGHWIIAANASYKKTWNDNELLNYQNISDVTVTSAVVALEEFDGRYGVLDRNIDRFRFALSTPFYISRINPVPYVVLVSTSNKMPKYTAGLFVNILRDSITPGKFTIPSSVGVGIDWNYSGEKQWSPANIFIKGSINLGPVN